MATGMGSGAATSRVVAYGMGPSAVASTNGFILAEHQCVLGCAVAAVVQMGGRDDSRPAFRRENAAKESKLHICSGGLISPGHRGKYGNLSVARCGAFAVTAGEESSGACR